MIAEQFWEWGRLLSNELQKQAEGSEVLPWGLTKFMMK